MDMKAKPDMQAFWREMEQVSDELSISRHPFVQLVEDGKATKQQLKQFCIEHYEMTVRDSGIQAAAGYMHMYGLSAIGAKMMADGFAEEALGLYTRTASHLELFYEFWEKGLGLPRKELEESSASSGSRAVNAHLWVLFTSKIKYVGAGGVVEGGFSPTCEKMMSGLQKHYGMKPEALRFFSGHMEADKDHGDAARKMIGELITTEREQRECIKEARCIGELFRKGYDAMM